MKIIKATEVKSVIVETDSDEYPIYRRTGPDCWENLMGCSWESCYSGEDFLEEMYQEYLKTS